MLALSPQGRLREVAHDAEVEPAVGHDVRARIATALAGGPGPEVAHALVVHGQAVGDLSVLLPREGLDEVVDGVQRPMRVVVVSRRPSEGTVEVVDE